MSTTSASAPAGAPYTLALTSLEIDRYRMMAGRARREEALLWRAAGIRAGALVVDLGCGPGAIAIELAGLVAPGGAVTAVDRDPHTLAAARAILAGAGADNVRLVAAEASATGLEPGSHDVVMIRHVLAHGGAAVDAILAHAFELLRPGGHLFVVDSDVRAFRVVPEDPDLREEHDRYIELLCRQGADPSIGPTLAHRIEAHGFEVADFGGRYEVFWQAESRTLGPARAARKALLDSGLASAEDAARWDAAGERFLGTTHGRYLMAPIFHALAHRP